MTMPMMPRSSSSPNLSMMGREPPMAMAPPGSMGGMVPEIVLEITRLLDMPMQEKLFSSDLKQYRVRAFEDYNGTIGKEIGSTRELAGVPEQFNASGDVDTETIRLGPEGILRVRTQTPIIHLLVEYAGGFFGNRKIGRCRIARADQRSSQIWPYALSDPRDDGEPVGSGIELRVAEGVPPPGPPGGMSPMAPSFHTMPPQGPMEPSFRTMPPSEWAQPGSGPMPPPMSGP